MDRRTVQTVDTPGGGFIVLDHVASVAVRPMIVYNGVSYPQRGTYVVVCTIVGAEITVGFPFEPVLPDAETFGTGERWEAEYHRRLAEGNATTDAQAEAWAAELRYCIEHP